MMKLMTMKQFEKKSKETLIRFITKQLRKKSRKTLASVAYHMTKAKLPRLKVTKRKALPRRKTKRKSLAYNDLGFGESLKSMRKKKRKFSQRQLKAQRLFAKRARAGTLKRRRR